ncbi:MULTISPECIES: hypothetical protein [Rhodopseudomonas]|uniref:Uncharacterized protein n=1 Tax=Rhodopseudomonas palustris TaxID=1076 RepID=A0A0D7EPT4_RHOPL|nr:MULTISPECIES: hypothetical protein [Rhodopseudomonas]KIZ41472.1 hypothetical protein OO17_15030 [Rhodopseudomonas palustris]MDF3812434.1 hypothetical protein [Rhodopseudomonas sp. BAL398]WOK19433.1 hypothetical protein RBJ75_07940 [Rhodopseudomonas sp. BAL398]
MFGISPLGWVHTLGSLPAIPTAVYMIARYGRIVPRSTAGTVYLVSMLIGAVTVFLVARQPISYGIGAATLALVLAGYAVGSITMLGRAAPYLETIFLSLSVFLLMLPTVSETLRRVPDGHPLAADLHAPILLGAQAAILAILLIGLPIQLILLRRRSRLAAS